MTVVLKDINQLNEITHNHSIVAIRDSFSKYPNRYLVYYDEKWKCKLFVNYKENENNENFIIDHLSRELKLSKSSIKLKYINTNLSEKESADTGIIKLYSHKLYLADISEFPDEMKQDSFSCDGRTYYWESITDLENDETAMSKNADIIKFVKNNI